MPEPATIRRARRRRSRVALALGVAVAALLLPASASASILIVGDSLTQGNSPTLEQIASSVTIDAVPGRPSSAGVAALADDYRGQDVVAFDLGTNDDPSQPQALLANLQRARQIVGGACLIVATINRPPVGGVSYKAMNRALETFAIQDGNAQIVPWQLATKLHPEVVFEDGVHVTPYGYEFRAHLFATAIRECPGGAGAITESMRQGGVPPPSGSGTPPPQERPPQPPPGPSGPVIWITSPAPAVLGAIAAGVDWVVTAALGDRGDAGRQAAP